MHKHQLMLTNVMTIMYPFYMQEKYIIIIIIINSPLSVKHA